MLAALREIGTIFAVLYGGYLLVRYPHKIVRLAGAGILKIVAAGKAGLPLLLQAAEFKFAGHYKLPWEELPATPAKQAPPEQREESLTGAVTALTPKRRPTEDTPAAPAEAERKARAIKPKSPRSRTAKKADQELEQMIGLAGVKKRIREIADLAWLDGERVAAGQQPLTANYHMVFSGNPGTGKTDLAKIVSRIFRDLGILSKGHFVEANRAKLVGQYIGETAKKVTEIVESALGGVLFIDEAYLLVPHSEKDYGAEAIGTLLELMDKHRGELIVIAAGYKAEMEQFIASNPGLQSRFATIIDFPDYDADELYLIFELHCRRNAFTLSESAQRAAKQEIGKLYAERGAHFGNGREMRNLVERCAIRLAARVRPEWAGGGDLNLLTAHDIGEQYDGLENPEEAMPWLVQEQEVERLQREREEIRQRMRELGMPLEDEIRGHQDEEIAALEQERADMEGRLGELEPPDESAAAPDAVTGNLDDEQFCALLEDIQDSCLGPALGRASSVEGMPAPVLVVAQFEAALTSCFVMSDGDPRQAVRRYREFSALALEWQDRCGFE